MEPTPSFIPRISCSFCNRSDLEDKVTLCQKCLLIAQCERHSNFVHQCLPLEKKSTINFEIELSNFYEKNLQPEKPIVVWMVATQTATEYGLQDFRQKYGETHLMRRLQTACAMQLFNHLIGNNKHVLLVMIKDEPVSPQNSIAIPLRQQRAELIS